MPPQGSLLLAWTASLNARNNRCCWSAAAHFTGMGHCRTLPRPAPCAAQVPATDWEALKSPLMGLFEKRRAAKFFSFCQQYDERNPQVGAAGHATRAPVAAAAAAARAPACKVAGKEGLTSWQPWPAA